MDIAKLAAITSSVHRFLKPSQDDCKAGLARIRDIGYQAVQISGLGDYDPQWMRKTCDELDLTICGVHEKGGEICENPTAIADKCDVLGTRYVGYPFPHLHPMETLDKVRQLCELLNQAGRVLAERDKVIVYHNHNIEFVRFDGKPVLEWIYELTDARFVQGEPDTHWIQAGGGDPAAWCDRLAGRLPVLHMKDFGINMERERQHRSIGDGNLDWHRIIPAAERAGCEWFVVEHDGGTFESLEFSYRYVTENFCR